MAMRGTKQTVSGLPTAPAVTYIDTCSAIAMSNYDITPQITMYAPFKMVKYEMESRCEEGTISESVMGMIRPRNVDVPMMINQDIEHAFSRTSSDRKYQENHGSRKAAWEIDKQLITLGLNSVREGKPTEVISNDSDVTMTLQYLLGTLGVSKDPNYGLYSWSNDYMQISSVVDLVA